ncbi:MAG TPA: phage holin family protein [Thiobacillaceae bacterium]|nr:phage holin family protein [Thiobacillaceae bacterium]
MAGEARASGGGLFDSLKVLAGSLVAIVHTRLELLSNDVEEARAHFLSLLVLGLVTLFFLGVGLVLLTILIAVAFWESHRLAALGGLTAFFLLGGIGLGWLVTHKMRARPRLFEASLEELARDRQQLTSEP